jgi:hypothetical protein
VTRQASRFDHRQIQRHPHRQVRPQRRIHRQQHRLLRIRKAGVGLDHAVQDRLAVFVLADLQEGRVLGRLDEIALGIDQEHPHPPPLRWPATIMLADAPCFMVASFSSNLARAPASVRPTISATFSMVGAFRMRGFLGGLGVVDASRRRAMVVCVTDKAAAVIIAITRSPGFSKAEHLAIGGDVVQPRIGAGVRQQHHPGIQQKPTQ